ncbi:hypothetical protein [Mycoplasmopsis verecunda]|uniref:Lipoprotein n=1 Tax=Mycoplasmopsis verecunda TaxID=171291 RepID=A0A1T4KF09_9BACT|nr:hypothetical protein [Mycoplasmopsis verecunda]WPB54881.1 hypothetical protein SAM46_01855 [Mycoplasmopsis verecunda]SJZ41014.1 hypothetical protein SAMN02745154_00029 [Mycoplasmopsis verecunda]
MKKIFKLLTLSSAVIIPTISAVSCYDTGDSRLKVTTPSYVEKLREVMSKYNLNFSQKQEENLKKFDYNSYAVMHKNLKQNTDKIIGYNAQMKEVAQYSDEYYALKTKRDQLLTLNQDILSDNILGFLQYIYYFEARFYDYGLLTFNRTKNDLPKHSDRYLHWAANVQNEYSSANEAIHQHFRYQRNDVKISSLLKPQNIEASELIYSPLKQGYKVLYLRFKTMFLKIYVSSENEIILSPEIIFFSGASLNNPPSAQEVLEMMEKNPLTLTPEDIAKFEEKFASLPNIKYPQYNLIF